MYAIRSYYALGTSILGAYALSKKRLVFRRGLNFYLVFTLWFSAGLVPQFLNYKATQNIFGAIGIADDKWLVVIAVITSYSIHYTKLYEASMNTVR